MKTKEEKKEETISIICPSCDNYPFLNFDKEKPKEIFINCDYCGYSKRKQLHFYLSSLKISDKQRKKNLCQKHNKPYTYFCSQCKEHFCSVCNLNVHESHLLIQLMNIQTSSLTQKINQGYEHIDNYCNELKLNMIQSLNNQINQIEKSYQSFKVINNDILELVKLIVDNYNNEQNYYLMTNLMNIMDINIYKCCEENTTEGIISYFDNYSIIKDSDFDVSTIKNIKTISEHHSDVYSLLLLQDGRLASCSFDTTIKIYNINNNYKCDITLEGHTDNVYYISETKNGKLISCSADKSIKIWNITKSSYRCEHTIENAHNHWVLKVIPLSKNRIASCSSDKTIKIWNSEYPYSLIETLTGHTCIVVSIIQIYGKEILISAESNGDKTLRIWNLASYQCKKEIKNVECWWSNSLIEIDDERILVGGKNSLTIVNIKQGKIEKKIEKEELNYVRSLMMFSDGNVLCGCRDGVMCLFDTKLKILTIKDNNSHSRAINDIVSTNEHQFISCSGDKTIKVWEY